MKDDKCIFCKIVEEVIPAEKIEEDEISISFLDINPVNLGHTLIIPKGHFKSITETPDDLVAKLFVKAKNFIPKLQNATGADFVVISIVGIDVPHFHIHLIPRFYNDNLSNFWPTKKYKNVEEMKEVAENIRGGISNY